MSVQSDLPLVTSECIPRDDVVAGEIEEEQYAASVYSVAHGTNVPEVYDNPTTFFDRTYPTDGLQEVLEHVASRLTASSEGRDSAYNGTVTLDTAFGGGKTHSQIAAYHLATAGDEIPNLDQYVENKETAREYQSALSGVSVNTGVFVGGKYGPLPVRPEEDAPEIQTMWGHLAYQLFGWRGYDEIEEFEDQLVSPGGQALDNLFSLSDAPSVVIIDEIAAYLAHASGVSIESNENLGGRTLNFLMSLLQYAAETKKVTVVMSVAADAFEDFAKIFDEEISQAEFDINVDVPIAKETVQEFKNLEMKFVKKIKPTSDDEVTDVLRNRLFEKPPSEEIRQQVASEYRQLYEADKELFPDEATKPTNEQRLANAYPFHPTVIDTLTKEIDSLPSFQKTRGALRLLSRAIHRLWNNETASVYDRHFIRLYDVHPADKDVFNKLTDLFGDIEMDFAPAVKDDIYNTEAEDDSNAEREDEYWRDRDQPPLGTQLTTTAIWKSLVKGAGRRGTTRKYLRYAVARPGETLAHYDSALNNLLGDRPYSACSYLHGRNSDRIKFRTVVTIEKAINQAEPGQGIVKQHIEEALYESALGETSLKLVENPQSAHQVPDSMEFLGYLCVMEHSTLTINKADDIADTIVPKLYEKTSSSKHGDISPRTYKNNLIFLVASGNEIANARREARRVASIEIVSDEPEDFSLEKAQIDELPSKRDEARADLDSHIKKAYSHVYVPAEEDPTQPYEGLSHYHLTVTNTITEDLLRKLEDNGEVIDEDEGAYSANWFSKRVWKVEADSMTTKEVKQQMGKRRDAELLLDSRPLRKTVKNVVTDADSEYVYWDGDQAYLDRSVFNEQHDELEFDEARNLSTAERLNTVELSEDHRVYATSEALLEAVDITWECRDCGDVFHSTPEYREHQCLFVCDECGEEFGSQADLDEHLPCGDYSCPDCKQSFRGERALQRHQPCPWPLELNASTNDPAVISEAVSTLSMGIDRDTNEAKAKYDGPPTNLVPEIQRILIRTSGGEGWKAAWFLADKLDNIDAFEDISVEFEYRAEYDGSEFSMRFSGDHETFVDKFHFNIEPSGSPDDQYVEGNLRMSLEASRDVLDELEDAIPNSVTMEIQIEGEIRIEEALTA